jgi:hypothetical protein
MATGDVQRNRIVKSELGVNICFCRNVLFLFSFRFFSFLAYFVSFPLQRNFVSFRFVSFFFFKRKGRMRDFWMG